MNRDKAMIFSKTFYQNNWFSMNDALSEITLFQFYELLLIHFIDAICTTSLSAYLNLEEILKGSKRGSRVEL